MTIISDFETDKDKKMNEIFGTDPNPNLEVALTLIWNWSNPNLVSTLTLHWN